MKEISDASSSDTSGGGRTVKRAVLLPPEPREAVTLATGQVVPWPPAPLGWAQVVELRRTRVRLLYRCRTGRIRQPVTKAADLAELLAKEQEPTLPLTNPFGRAAMGRAAKEFEIYVKMAPTGPNVPPISTAIA